MTEPNIDSNIPNVEETDTLSLDYMKIANVYACGKAVLPVVIQDYDTKEVLILGYATKKALDHTIETKIATLWSTSRNELWIKGSTSGQTLSIVEIRVNCEQNSLLYLVKSPTEGACHTKDGNKHFRKSCYYRRIDNNNQLSFI